MTIYLIKVGNIFGDLLGYSERHHILSKNAVNTYWATFVINWTTFVLFRHLVTLVMVVGMIDVVVVLTVNRFERRRGKLWTSF